MKTVQKQKYKSLAHIYWLSMILPDEDELIHILQDLRIMARDVIDFRELIQIKEHIRQYEKTMENADLIEKPCFNRI